MLSILIRCYFICYLFPVLPHANVYNLGRYKYPDLVPLLIIKPLYINVRRDEKYGRYEGYDRYWTYGRYGRYESNSYFTFAIWVSPGASSIQPPGCLYLSQFGPNIELVKRFVRG